MNRNPQLEGSPPDSLRHRAFEEAFHPLVGARLRTVRYFEIEYEGSVPAWDQWRDLGHSLDFGLDLELSGGQTYALTWGREFFQYGIEIVKGSLRSHLDRFAEIYVSESREWKPYIGEVVRDTQVFWSWVTNDDDVVYYPQDVALTFGDRADIYVSASQYWPEERRLIGFADNLFVVFCDEVARRHQLGPYALS